MSGCPVKFRPGCCCCIVRQSVHINAGKCFGLLTHPFLFSHPYTHHCIVSALTMLIPFFYRHVGRADAPIPTARRAPSAGASLTPCWGRWVCTRVTSWVFSCPTYQNTPSLFTEPSRPVSSSHSSTLSTLQVGYLRIDHDRLT